MLDHRSTALGRHYNLDYLMVGCQYKQWSRPSLWYDLPSLWNSLLTDNPKLAVFLIQSQWKLLSTPTFPPDSCYLSGAPFQMIDRCLSDGCQMPHQTPVNSNQTSVRQVPHLHETYLVYMWCLSDRCLVGHLTGIWQSSDDHLTGSTRQIANVWWKRWCIYNSGPMVRH